MLLPGVASATGLAVEAAGVDVRGQRVEEVRSEHAALLGPFRASEWSIRRRGSGSFVSRARRFAAPFSPDSTLALVSPEQLEETVEAVITCLATLPPPVVHALEEPLPALEPGAGRVVLSTEARHLIWAVRPDADPCGRLVRDRVDARVGTSNGAYGWSHPFWLAGEFGMVQLDATPPAEVSIDGRPLGVTTPVVGLRLEPGRYRVRWALPDGTSREETIEVYIGQTTAIRVTL